MKKITTPTKLAAQLVPNLRELILAALLSTGSAFAQAPQKMTYQAVVRNSSDALVQSSPVGMKVSILQGSVTGTAVYVETHTAQTNQNGLLDIVIGGGTIVSGYFLDSIFWGGGPYFLKTEIDPLGGTAYTITSTSELLSVPYSNYSHVSGVLAGWASDYIGGYKNSGAGGANNTWSAFITYLAFDKVAVKMHFETHDPGNSYDYTWFATLLGDSITFPASGNFMGVNGSGTRNGNSLIFSLNFPFDFFQTFSSPVTYTFDLIKL